MAQTYYTLEEAAKRLGITPEEMKRRLREDWKTIRPFRDGSTLRFRESDIEDLARSMDADSDPDLLVDEFNFTDDSSEASSTVPAKSPFDLGNESPTVAAQSLSAPPKKGGNDSPLNFDSDDDMFVLAPDSTPPKKPVDSDVKLGKGKKSPPPTDAESEDVPFTLQLEDDSPISSPQTGPVKLPSDASLSDDSEFDLSLEGSSEFQLEFTDDSDSDSDSEEVSLGDLPVSRSGNRGGESGINLGSPADSGISLEKKGPKSNVKKGGKTGPIPSPSSADEDINFELSLDLNASSTGRHGGPPSSRNLSGDESSEFDLDLPDLAPDSMMDDDPASSLELDQASGDIFETDFDIPVVDDSASESLALEEADTDLEGSSDLALDDDGEPLDESASEVVVVDEEIANASKSKRRRRIDDDDDDIDYDDLDSSDSASKALAGVKHEEGDDEDEDEPVAGVYRPAKYGIFTITMLAITTPVIFLTGLMGYELLHSMWGYQTGNRPSAMVIKLVAGTFDLAPKDQ